MTFIDYMLIALLSVAVAGVIVYLVKQKRQGKTGCGCGCGSCPHAGSCRGANGGKPVETEDERNSTTEDL